MAPATAWFYVHPTLYITDRVRSTTVRYCFHRVSVCPHPGGREYPRYLPPPPSQGTYPPGQVLVGGYPKVPTPLSQGTYPPPGQVPTGEGGTQGTSPLAKVPNPPPARFQWGGAPRYLPPCQGTYPPRPGPDGGARGTPRYLPPPTPAKVPCPPTGIGQHMEYLIRRGRYASCVHAERLFSLILFILITKFFCSTLPDVLVTSTSYIQYISFYRQSLADALDKRFCGFPINW